MGSSDSTSQDHVDHDGAWRGTIDQSHWRGEVHLSATFGVTNRTFECAVQGDDASMRITVCGTPFDTANGDLTRGTHVAFRNGCRLNCDADGCVTITAHDRCFLRTTLPGC